MENRVGDLRPTPQQLAAWATTLATLFEEMKPFLVKLTPAEKRHLAQFRPGGERIVELVARVAKKYGVHLQDMPTVGMLDDLGLSRDLAPIADQIGLISSWLADTISAARSEAWQAATGNYSVLARVGEANPSVQHEIKPARAFFRRRKRGEVLVEEETEGEEGSEETEETEEGATDTKVQDKKTP